MCDISVMFTAFWSVRFELNDTWSAKFPVRHSLINFEVWWYRFIASVEIMFDDGNPRWIVVMITNKCLKYYEAKSMGAD